MNIKASKYILGTANLWSKYGQKSKFIDTKKSLQIINFAYKKNIKILDVSSNYPSFENLLKHIKFKKFKLSFKISSKEIKKLKNKKKIENYILNLFKKFKKYQIEYFLFHNFKDIFSQNSKKIFRVLKKLQKEKKIKYIGVSIYKKYEMLNVLKNKNINLIQIPLNVLNQDFNINNLTKLLKRKIQIHIRSIFLQGVLIDQKILSNKLKKNKKIKSWYKFLNKNKISSIQANLSFINQFKFVNKIIIGVRNKEQLKQILKTKLIKNKISFDQFKSNNPNLIDPRKW